MSKSADHYAVLGVPPNATQEQIKAAYRRLAMRHHPDKNASPEAADQFRRCTDAYDVLSDERKRSSYDRMRLGQASVPQLFGELLQDLVGRDRSRRRRDGRDVEYTMHVGLLDAATGVRKRIEFPVSDPCAPCAGVGAAPGGTRPCSSCKGKGEVRGQGLLSLPHSCPRCGGSGISIQTACKRCRGVGTVETTRAYVVTLPAGVRDDDVRLVRGQGEPGQFGGRTGDLIVKVKVDAHPLLVVDDDDVKLDLPVTLVQAALGATVAVPTLYGEVRMKLPAGTQSGRLFRLRSKGLPSGIGRRGDQIVRVLVETPTSLGDTERRMLERLDDVLTAAMQPRRHSFIGALEKLREAKTRTSDERGLERRGADASTEPGGKAAGSGG